MKISSSLFVIFLTLVFPNLAHAYVDPGSGHLVLQLLLAFVAGALFYMKAIVEWFRGNASRTTEASSDATDAAQPFATSNSTNRSRKANNKKTRVHRVTSKKRT